MADYKNLAETLRFCATDGECKSCPGGAANCAGVFGFFDALLTKAADAIEELLDDAPKWISVADRLPTGDEGDWVLGIANGEYNSIRLNDALELVEYDAETGSWFLHEELHAEVTVTHWMPLPEPPEEG